MKKLMQRLARNERGFTLVELVVVIAILGVLAAIATPLVVNFLGSSKAEAYKTEKLVIQTAVEGYFSDPGNARFLGKRILPLIGRDETAQSGHSVSQASNTGIDDDQSPTANAPGGTGSLTLPYWNPLGGQRGHDISASWADGPSGSEDGVREVNESGTVTEDLWSTVTVTRNNILYHVDPRYYIIDMEELVEEGFMDSVPGSAAFENCTNSHTGDVTCSGSYIWYLDDKGRVQSLLDDFPSTGGFADVFP